MLYLVLIVGFLICALQAVRAPRLLSSALWLMATSALVALALYWLGAFQVAVIELSVGAGLVTVLFVFAIGIAGEEIGDVRSIVPKPLATVLILLFVVLAGSQTIPFNVSASNAAEPAFVTVVWEQRALDMGVQIVLIFAGALGVLSLLAERVQPPTSKVEKPFKIQSDYASQPEIEKLKAEIPADKVRV